MLGQMRSEIRILRDVPKPSIGALDSEAQQIVRLVASPEDELVLTLSLRARYHLGKRRILNAGAKNNAGWRVRWSDCLERHEKSAGQTEE